MTAEDAYATDAEIEAAVRGLSDADAARLAKIATFRARSLQALGLGIDGVDLLQEAIERTVRGATMSCPGARRWPKSVPFVKYLAETMRSIASHARESLEGVTVMPASQEDPDGRMDGLVLTSRSTDLERLAAAREKLDQIDRKFATDDTVRLIIEGLSTGMTGPEIQKELGINDTQFETAMTRLRRGIDRKAGWQP